MAESRLIALLKEKHYLSPETASAIRQRGGQSLAEVLITGGYLTHSQLKEFYETVKIPSYNLIEKKIDGQALGIFPHELALLHTAMPVSLDNRGLLLAVADPLDYEMLENISLLIKHPVSAFYADPNEIKLFIGRYYGAPPVTAAGNDRPIKLVDSLIQSAILYSASDIHIEPLEKYIRIRFRIDGHLKEHQRIDSELLPYVISRLKILGGMDIAEKRLPQDGHFKLSDTGIDLRLSTIPTIYGEKAVLRLIYTRDNFQIGSLGFFTEDLGQLRRLLKNPYGAILVTGPTGSGKTTTLSCFVSELNKDDINIVTVEDPVENVIPGVNQISINEKTGLTFDKILPYILRQDPDVIMIGEIRSADTASIAVRSAITGHLVLSTLHTNDALGAVLRLLDMGIESFLITAAIKGVISQRLVRKICPHCKERVQISKDNAGILKLPQDTIVYRGRGCPYCGNSGYKGRFAVYEILILNPEFKEMLNNKVSQSELTAYLCKNGMITLWENTLKNVLAGNTTISEMYRVLFQNI